MKVHSTNFISRAIYTPKIVFACTLYAPYDM